MADRRMFNKKITESDAFLDMPSGAQSLYFHLSIIADDDGFINNPKTVMRMLGAKNEDLDRLIAEEFIIAFESGVVAIRHWKVHNYIRKDRYQPTLCQKELSQLITDSDGTYFEYNKAPGDPTAIFDCAIGSGSYFFGQPTVNQRLTQDSIGEDRIGKVSIGEGSTEESSQTEESSSPSLGKYKNISLSSKELDALKSEFPTDWEARIDRLSEYMASSGKKYNNHLATIRSWAKTDKNKSSPPRKKGGLNNYTDTNTIDYAAYQDEVLRQLLNDS